MSVATEQDQVLALLPGSAVERSLIEGVSLLTVRQDTLSAVAAALSSSSACAWSRRR